MTKAPPKLNARQATKLLQSVLAKQGALNLQAANFPSQNKFIDDGARLKAALCTRRSGKSYAIGLMLYKAALANPGSTCVYIALTRQSAKKIMWKDILKRIDRDHNLNAEFHNNDLMVRLPNKSEIYLAGANASKEESDKFLGVKYKLAVIDECASFTQDLRYLVYGVLKPAMADVQGTIALIGTPGNLVRLGGRRTNAFGILEEKAEVNSKPLFYAVTTGEEPGWSLHKWSALENPFVRWQEEIDDLVGKNPRIKETPLFKQHYLGEWYVDLDALVYKYDPVINNFNTQGAKLPPTKPNIEFLLPHQFTYVMGIDLGYNDATAMVVVAYSNEDGNLYVVDCFKESKMTVSKVEKKIEYYRAKYPISKFVIDTGSKQVVEELRARTQIPFEAASKVDKAGFIHLMNNDLMMGKIKLLMPQCDALVTEWQGLIWDERSDRLQENDACENHLSDAALYAWRYSYNYLMNSVTAASRKPNTEEWVNEWWEKELDKANRDKKEFWLEDWKEYE